MAKLIKFITYAYLREECDLPQNLPEQEVEQYIYRAQEDLRASIGDAFYQDFKASVEANSFSAAYTSLLPYVKQYLAWRTNELWTPRANFKVTRAGFRVHSEENSVVATDIQMAAIIKDAKYRSDYYKNLLMDFLSNHSEDYTLFDKCCTKKTGGFKMSVIKKRESAADIYNRGSRLGGSYKCCE